MIILSEDRQKSLAYLIINELLKQNLVSYTSEEEARRWAMKGMASFIKDCEDTHVSVEKKIKSLKRNVMENSDEWNILYSKYYDDELIKKGQS